jgi:hypothetical protein
MIQNNMKVGDSGIEDKSRPSTYHLIREVVEIYTKAVRIRV